MTAPRLAREARRRSHGHVDGFMKTWRRVDAVAATTRSETAQNRNRNHRRHRLLETSRIDGVRVVGR
jgi:hypothetical protein